MTEIFKGAHTRWQSRYRFVWSAKYRHQIITPPVAKYLKEVVVGICERYEHVFDSMGTDGDHIHLLVGAPPSQKPEVIIKTVKSITARQVFKKFLSIKNSLWGGSIWAVGYYFGTVRSTKSIKVMRDYVLNQGTKQEKTQIEQLKLL